MNVVPISDFRTNLPNLINQVNEGLQRFIVTVSGKPKAVVISLDELESLEETAEVLADTSTLKAIKESREQIRKGDFISFEELKKKHKL